ncbi:hypothetical protein FQZ97_875810 [compost metagenome]
MSTRTPGDTCPCASAHSASESKRVAPGGGASMAAGGTPARSSARSVPGPVAQKRQPARVEVPRCWKKWSTAVALTNISAA